MKENFKKVSLVEGGAYCSAILIVIIWILVSIATLGRYFFGVPLSWTIQLSEFSLLFATYFSAAWILKEGGHVRVEILLSKLSATKRRFFENITLIIIIFVSIVLLIYGLIICRDYYLSGVITEGIIKIPRSFVIMFIPLSSILLLVQTIKMLFKKKGKEH